MKKLLIFGSFALIVTLVIIVLKPNHNTGHNVAIRYAQTQMRTINRQSSFQTRSLTTSTPIVHSTFKSPTLSSTSKSSKHYQLLSTRTQAKNNSFGLGQSNQNTSHSQHQVLGNTTAQNITFQPVSSTQSSQNGYTPFQEPIMMMSTYRQPVFPGSDPSAVPLSDGILALGLIAGAWILKKRLFKA